MSTFTVPVYANAFYAGKTRKALIKKLMLIWSAAATIPIQTTKDLQNKLGY